MTPFSFDRVVLFGASILNSFGLNGRLTQYLFDQYGLTVALTNAAVGGDNAQNGRDRIDSVVAAVPEGETAVFVVHLGGNDIGGGNSIWENAGNRATYVSNMTYIYNAIVNAGHVCVFCTISFRQFGTPTNSVGDFGGNSYDDPEAYGADKVNVEVLIPMIASLDPSQINTDGRPYMDFHNWVYNSGPFIIDTDGRHLIEYKGPCKWIGDVLYSLSTTGASPVVNRVADPRIAGAHRPASVHLNFQSEGLGPDCYIKGLNTIVTGYSYLLGPDNSPAGIRCQAPATGSFGNNGRGTTTQKQLDYLSGAQTASYNRVAAFYGEQCRTFWEEVCLGEWGLASTYPGYEWMFRLSIPEGVAEYVDSVRRYCYDEASEWVFGVNGGAGGRRAVTSMELRVLRQTDESSMAVLYKMVSALHGAAGDK